MSTDPAADRYILEQSAKLVQAIRAAVPEPEPDTGSDVDPDADLDADSDPGAARDSDTGPYADAAVVREGSSAATPLLETIGARATEAAQRWYEGG